MNDLQFERGAYDEPSGSELWKLDFDDKCKKLPELIAPLLAQVCTSEERDRLVLHLYFKDRIRASYTF